MENRLVIDSISITRSGTPVLTGCSFGVCAGELVILAGANGAGKSSLLLSIMGHPSCVVTSGDVLLDGSSIIALPTHERAKRGLFLAHQEPPTIAGVTISGMIRAQAEAMGLGLTIPQIQERIQSASREIGVDEVFSRRMLGAGLSGGEKKRAELLQLLALPPKIVLLDEVDAGLDADGRDRLVAALAKLRMLGAACVVVTHNPDLADRLAPTSTIHLHKHQ